jgi:hypothetical protein
MRLAVIFLIVFSVFTSKASLAADLATLSGRPDFSLEFVTRLLERSEDLAPDFQKENWGSTIHVSIFDHLGVRSIVNFEMLSWDGFSSTPLIQKALRLGAAEAPVVTHDLEPETTPICNVMAAYPNTIFVITAGAGGAGLRLPPGCDLPNILRVAALNSTENALMGFSNFGANVKVAAPGQRVPGIGPGGEKVSVVGGQYAVAWAAGSLASFARNNPSLRGPALIEAFLNSQTMVIPTIKDKIPGGRALARGGI